MNQNFMSNGNAASILAAYANSIKGKADLLDIVPAFSTSTAYAVGDYVNYNGNVYKCTTAHSAGAWVAGDFTQTNVKGMIDDCSVGMVTNAQWASIQTLLA